MQRNAFTRATFPENEKQTLQMILFEKIRYRLVWNHARRLNARGEGLVQIEMQQGRRRRYLSTHTYLPPENWCRGWVVGTPDDNARNYALRRMMWEVEQVELEYIKKGMRLTLPALVEAVKASVSPAAKLRDFVAAMLEGSDRRDTTKQNYRTLSNDIERWRPNTYLNDIDYQWVQAYDRHQRERGVAHNTRVSRLRMLRAVVNEALSRELMSQDPFRRMKMEGMEAKKGYLTSRQLRQLEQMQFSGKEERARDLFLVGCYTGLRFSDIRTLRQTDIGADGWLRKRTQKTGAEVSIPIGDLFDGRMLGLIEKYKGDIGRLCSKAPPNSDVNRTLKPLLAKVKAQERVTFHSSRHTFATLLSERGLSPETIQHLLGHASAQTTQIYNEHAADRRREIMKDLVSLKHRKAR